MLAILLRKLQPIERLRRSARLRSLSAISAVFVVFAMLAVACYPDNAVTSNAAEEGGGATTTIAEEAPATTEGSAAPEETETTTGETDTGETDTGETTTGETDTGETDTGETTTDGTDTGETDTGETDTAGGAEETDECEDERDGSEAAEGEDDPCIEMSEEEDSLELDPNLILGTLPNGLTYYIRHNDSPGERAELRLVVKVGSSHETEEQSGYAHFLEHMMFNGTKSYPRNELIATLESLGSEYGPDLNAFTTFTFTNYHLSLPNPELETIETGLDVLLEWAVHATLNEVDVVEERAVVAEEYRLRRLGLRGRFAEVSDELLLRGSNLYGKDPLGTPESINAANSEDLRRFYEDWYRPELMAVVAVGDFGTNDVKQLITTRFSSLTASESDSSDWSAAEMSSLGEPQTTFQIDPEYPSAAVIALQLAPQPKLHTKEGQRVHLARRLGFDILTERLRNDRLRGTAPFDDSDFFDAGYAPAVNYLGAVLYTEASEVLLSVEAVLSEFERIRQHGFGPGEFDRAAQAVRRELEQDYASRSTKQDRQFANDYIYHFTWGTLPWSATDARNISESLLDEITPEEAAAAVAELMEVEPPRLWIVANSSAAESLPDEEEIAALRERIEETELPLREDFSVSEQNLMERPEPAEVTNREALPHGITQLDFPNGARVFLQPTTIAAETVHLWAVSAGGFSVLADEDVMQLSIAAEIAGKSGVGEYDPVTLGQLLADDVLSFSLDIDHNTEFVIAESATEDLETLLGLLHLSMTEPRSEEAIAEAELRQLRQLAENRDVLPSFSMSLAVSEARYGDDPRFRSIPTLEEVDSFDLDSGMEELRRRFADAGDFYFMLIGDFDLDEAETLARSYIGTLPDGGLREEYVDPQRDPPDGIVSRTVRAGDDDQGRLVLWMTGAVETDFRTRIATELLENLLNTRLHKNLRENMGSTYDPSVSISSQDPDNLLESTISVTADPERLEEISERLLAELAALAESGPTEEEYEAAVSVLRSEYELVSNEYWGATLVHWVFNTRDEDLAVVGSRGAYIETLLDLTPEEITELSQIAFPSDRYIEVRLIPLE